MPLYCNHLLIFFCEFVDSSVAGESDKLVALKIIIRLLQVFKGFLLHHCAYLRIYFLEK